jgi:hypothetical protein
LVEIGRSPARSRGSSYPALGPDRRRDRRRDLIPGLGSDYLAEPFPMEGQRALVPPGPGLGITIDEDKVAHDARALAAA